MLSALILPKTENKSIKEMSDFVYIARELRISKKQFYQLYHNWEKKTDLVRRFARENIFVNFFVEKPHYHKPAREKIIEVELLRASSYINLHML